MGGSVLLSPAESSWRSLAAGEGTTRQGPLWHADGNILQLPSGSFVCFIKQLQTLRCFTAVYPAQPGGTFTTVLYGQIICNIKALMMTWNYPRFNYGISRRRQEQKTALHGCRPVKFCLRGCCCVTFGTRRLFSSSTGTIAPTHHTPEMKCCHEAMRGKRTHI